MENTINTILCPKCGSSEIEKRNHDQFFKKASAILLGSAGVAAGTVGGAATGASTGASIGAMAGPLGVIVGGAAGTLIGGIGIGITGGFLGNYFGKKAGVVIDKNIFLDFKCSKCNCRFKAQVKKP